MQAALNPANLRLHQDGKLFTFAETLQLIKDGARIASNTRFDPVFEKSFDKFPNDVKNALYERGVRLSTLVAKRRGGGVKSGESFVFSDGLGVFLVANEVFLNKHDLAIDLAKDNFSFETNSTSTTIYLPKESKSDGKVLQLADDGCCRVANESTLYLPLSENAPHPKGDFVWRTFRGVKSGKSIELAARMASRNGVNGDIIISWPLERLPVLEELDLAA